MPLGAPVTEHLDKVADAAYRCSGQGTFSKLYYINYIINAIYHAHIALYYALY